MTIQQVDVEIIRPLRSLVLRPRQPIESSDYDKDKELHTLHYANIVNQKICSVATFYPEPMLEVEALVAYRLRGMATHPNHRRQGLASSIMLQAVLDIQKLGCDLLWCKARLVAIDFYESLGFIKVGPIYEIEGIGPHYSMFKYL
tara:strand:- start:6849 stop:7283 length:435 start_codon:yes stop_codon:yes gene_type:complete